MSRIDKALRVWESSTGLDRPELEATRSSVRTPLSDYAREMLPSPETPNSPEQPDVHQASVPVRRPVRQSKSQVDADLEARLVTGGLNAVSLEQYRRLA